MIGLRVLLLFPLGAFVLIWGAYTIATGETGQLAPAVILGVLAVLLGRYGDQYGGVRSAPSARAPPSSTGIDPQPLLGPAS